ncbi:3'-5' exonuclease, putative [Plasmodium gallinaceum]|uniref:3'-5' exonuclease, putative n=1 Tax=Plasmodium gallinaceum TaxID=5849 RepID=A0A1J1GVV7_PLAGA|nr:3'-5' exonuclease, putative [Plasmodium gallinaceum]CRG95426.1 3'-5' exonuclease, putative [Plasmodium gallinaceum]
MYRFFNNHINKIFKRKITNISYGYLNLSIHDKIIHYFENLKKNIIYINDSKNCKEYINEIKKNLNEKYNFIGLDVEGYKIGKHGIISIIQICTENIYIFDLYKCDNTYLFIMYLKEILENEKIIKITHDCREDCSILYNQYNINLNNVFDTQVAYNLFLKKKKKDLYQISYDDLLFKCLLLNNNHKIYFHKIISLDPKVYLKRPISKELIQYAIQDVLYLKPLMLILIDKLNNIDEKKNILLDLNEEKKKVYNLDLHKIDLINYVIDNSQKYINYQFLNSHIKNEKKLQKGMIIEGMIVSCSNLKIYVKLNLSKKGVITNYLNHKYEIGDIVKCIILGFSGNNYINLGFSQSSNDKLNDLKIIKNK